MAARTGATGRKENGGRPENQMEDAALSIQIPPLVEFVDFQILACRLSFSR
jgi:hypothetical protein